VKRCSACGVEKPLEQFRRDSDGKQGRQSACKPCANARLDVWRAKTRERRLAYNRSYYNSDRGRAVIAGWQRRNPVKRRAQYLMNQAIDRGDLVKPAACESCHETKRLEGHHPDYAQPLLVMWLCRNCHKAWHRRYGEGLNAEAGAQSARD